MGQIIKNIRQYVWKYQGKWLKVTCILDRQKSVMIRKQFTYIFT